MARVAILADIHGNLPALEAVMADLARLAPDQVIVNGDIVNRGPQSKSCLAAVRATGWPVVFGNHEEYVLKFAAGELPDLWRSDLWLPTRHVTECELTEADRAYFRGLPWAHVIDAPGLPSVRVVHGSPRALNEGIGFWLSDADLLALAGGVPEPVLVGAHTHRPFERRVGDRWFLNSGAVGAPFNGVPDAQYLLLTGRNGDWQAEFRHVPYDRAPVYAAWEQSGQLARSMTAQVFKYEVETATFHLKTYFDFCHDRGLEPNGLASFRAYRDFSRDVPPGRSLMGPGWEGSMPS